MQSIWLSCFSLSILLAAGMVAAQPPGGFTDHGVAAPVGMSVWNGPVPAIDGAGRRVILIKLWAGTGARTTSYLLIDAETGDTRQLDPELDGGGAFSTFLSPDNKFYDAIADQFIEFDPATETISRVGAIPTQMPMSFTIDDNGVIYAGMYPNSEILSFDPKTRELRNLGPLAEETWPQYPYLAVDDSGWVYAAIQHQRGNIVGLDTGTGERRQFCPEEQRRYVDGAACWRGVDGKVYARVGKDGQWYRLHQGVAEPLEGSPEVSRAVYNTTVTPYGQWPDGSRFTTVDVANRTAMVIDAGAQDPREVHFDYESGGKSIYSLVASGDGVICGATGIPLRVFRFDPAVGGIENWGLGGHGGHINQWARQGGKLYGAVYSCGSLMEYDHTQPFTDAALGAGVNPKRVHYAAEARDLYGRPHAVLAHPDGEHLLVGGNPARGLVGGGLLIYNTVTTEARILGREELVPDQAVMALTALPDGDLIVGTAVEAATGGTTTATQALVYRISWATKQVIARWTPIPDAKTVADLIVGPDGLVYGLARPNHFFVLSPETGEVLHTEQVTQYGSITGMQAPRTMATGPDGGIYVLYRDAIARFEPGTFAHREVARPGVPITAGIVIDSGRIYFGSGPNLYSYTLDR